MRQGSQSSARGAWRTTLLALLLIIGAAPLAGGAALLHSFAQRQQRRADERGRQPNAPRETTLPRPARFRESEGRGLLVRVWVNGAGPYTFAVDTGAGATILSRHVAASARVGMDAGRTLEVGGLSNAASRSARRAYVNSLAVGERDNLLPARGLTVVAEGLPEDLDGILDPTEVYAPLGYVIDFPAETLSALDPRTSPLRAAASSEDDAVVPWLTEGGSRRPFVMLSGGRRALLDTGSSFGLAVTDASARALGLAVGQPRERAGVRDIAGGYVAARRVRPATVSVGPLVLRGVPTDLLVGAHRDAPALLGRDALRPFRLAFDPSARLIRISAR